MAKFLYVDAVSMTFIWTYCTWLYQNQIAAHPCIKSNPTQYFSPAVPILFQEFFSIKNLIWPLDPLNKGKIYFFQQFHIFLRPWVMQFSMSVDGGGLESYLSQTKP